MFVIVTKISIIRQIYKFQPAFLLFLVFRHVLLGFDGSGLFLINTGLRRRFDIPNLALNVPHALTHLRLVEIVEEKEVVREEVEQLEDYYQPTSPIYNNRESKPYGLDNSYNVPVHPYGGYERKEEKTYFKPSPIISPIYGILDKNYKKEDVREKKEVRITSNYTRSNVSVDDIRNKAYGSRNSQEKEISESAFDDSTKFEVEEDDIGC